LANSLNTNGHRQAAGAAPGRITPMLEMLPSGWELARDGHALGIPDRVQFHVLSFEGPDAYARIGGLESRVSGVCEALVEAGQEAHLWFVGDPDAPGHESRNGLFLHRFCQWISRHNERGVYDGEQNKVPDYAASLPPYLMREHLLSHLSSGGRAVVLAEEWHTADAVLHLDHLLREARLRDRVRILWNANNVFGFERIDWGRLGQAAVITTVSRYMKTLMAAIGIEAIAIPNGLSPDAYRAPDRAAVALMRRNFSDRIAITKMARWDPDKRWLATVDIVRVLRDGGQRPLLIARGGREPHGVEVLQAMRDAGLRIVDRSYTSGDVRGLADALSAVDGADVVQLVSHVDPDSRRALFRASDIVLANSGREPFGLVGLETMAAGGVACTGYSGEDYAVPGRNALVLQTTDPGEFVSQCHKLRTDAAFEASLRRAGRATARHFAWPEVIRTNLVPRLDLHAGPGSD
jgi:glycosyltransferase involved in cell wall biosynthesis